MTQPTTPHDVSKLRVLYAVPTSDAVRIQRDQRYGITEGEAPLALDVYYPPDAGSDLKTPAVVFVTGFSDTGARRMFGSAMKDMGRMCPGHS
jgi:hypothetical protein